MARPTDQSKTPQKRKSRGFQRAGATARKAVERIAGQHGFAEADVLLNWPAIAGEALAAVCQPVKVSYSRERTLGATLIVKTNSARAPEVEMKGPLIVERVNQHYGYRAVRRLKVTQSTGLGSGFAEAQARFTGPDFTPSAVEEAKGAEMAAGIQSPGLRAAVSRMGANVLARERSRTKSKE